MGVMTTDKMAGGSCDGEGRSRPVWCPTCGRKAFGFALGMESWSPKPVCLACARTEHGRAHIAGMVPVDYDPDADAVEPGPPILIGDPLNQGIGLRSSAHAYWGPIDGQGRPLDGSDPDVLLLRSRKTEYEAGRQAANYEVDPDGVWEGPDVSKAPRGLRRRVM